MKFKLIISIFLLFQGCATTKVFQPNQIPVSPRVGFLEGVTIDLAIFDGRVINEFSFEIINQISNQLKKTYPSAKFNILPINQFYKDPVPGRITIKIALVSYDAAFGSNITVVTVGTFGGDFGYGIIPEGKWNGITGFSINIYDGRNNNTVKKNIGNVVSLPNMWGYKTARDALDKSYKQSMQELLFFIDNTLMK